MNERPPAESVNARIVITGLGAAEKNAQEILEHVAAIKSLQAASWSSTSIEIEFREKEAASGN